MSVSVTISSFADELLSHESKEAYALAKQFSAQKAGTPPTPTSTPAPPSEGEKNAGDAQEVGAAADTQTQLQTQTSEVLHLQGIVEEEAEEEDPAATAAMEKARAEMDHVFLYQDKMLGCHAHFLQGLILCNLVQECSKGVHSPRTCRRSRRLISWES